MSSKVTPELRLKKLRRLQHNVICPNCGVAAPQGLGFGNVCVKFNTFICDLCKTSHQAISHRVKSITMSNWTNDEVNALTVEYGGGNEAALHIWLQNAPPFGGKYRGGSRPKEGDRIDIFKNFVTDCYEKGMFRASTPFVPNNSSAAPAPDMVKQAPVSLSKPVNPVRVAVVKPTETVDFFDAGANEFAAFSNTATGTGGSHDPFSSGSTFGDNSPQPVRDPFAAHSSFSSTSDLFTSAPPPPAPARAQASTSSGDYSFDAFGSDSPVPSSPFGATQPVFDAFPTAFPPAPVHRASSSASAASVSSSASGFDFIEGDPFSTNPAASNNNNITTGNSSSFGSFSSQVAVAPSYSPPPAAAAGFDFSGGSGGSITSSNVTSANNSVFASNNDLFGFSDAPSVLSAPSPLSVSVPAVAVAAAVHDPFGSVLLQPVSLTGVTEQQPAPVPTYGLQGNPNNNNTTTGLSSMQQQPQNRGGMMAAAPMNGSMNGSMGMGMGMGGGGGGAMLMMNRGGVSPVPNGMGGIGYGPALGQGQGVRQPGSNVGMGMGMGMMGPGVNNMGVGPGVGMAGQGMAPVMSYRPAGAAAASGTGMGMGVGITNGGGAYNSNAGGMGGTSNISDAFGSLHMGSNNHNNNHNAQSYRGSAAPQQQYQYNQGQGSFDFVQSALKQNLPPAPAPAPAAAQGTSRSGGSSPMSPMGSAMGGGGYQYSSQR